MLDDIKTTFQNCRALKPAYVAYFSTIREYLKCLQVFLTELYSINYLNLKRLQDITIVKIFFPFLGFNLSQWKISTDSDSDDKCNKTIENDKKDKWSSKITK